MTVFLHTTHLPGGKVEYLVPGSLGMPTHLEGETITMGGTV
ncbi:MULTISPECIES: hypothetical protein [Brachybacterium]|nr:MULTISPECIES: hypothetical protein [Brachybacterium]